MQFGSRVVLNDLDLDVASGTAAAIMGPSGSGKSTLLGVLASAIPADAGQVEFGPNAEEVRLALILQTVNGLPRRSVLDNIMTGALSTGRSVPNAHAAAREMAAALGLAHVSDQRLRSVSGGERQRMVVGRSLLSKPDVILADEPTAQLDATTASTVIDLLVGLRGDTTTVLVATHDPAVAARCDVVLRLEHGRVHEE